MNYNTVKVQVYIKDKILNEKSKSTIEIYNTLNPVIMSNNNLLNWYKIIFYFLKRFISC